MNNPRILTVKNAKFSGYHFCMNLNMCGDFQFCISVPLAQYKKIIETCTDRIEGVDKICRSAGMKFQPFQPEFHPTIIWEIKSQQDGQFSTWYLFRFSYIFFQFFFASMHQITFSSHYMGKFHQISRNPGKTELNCNPANQDHVITT